MDPNEAFHPPGLVLCSVYSARMASVCCTQYYCRERLAQFQHPRACWCAAPILLRRPTPHASLSLSLFALVACLARLSTHAALFSFST